MENSKRVWVWVGVAVIVVAVAGWAVWRWMPKKPAAPTVSAAPQGQLAPGFPQGLILDPKAQIGSSYSITYDATSSQYTAQWASSSSLATLFGEYKTYLNNNGYTVVNSSGGTAGSGLAIVNAVSLQGNANVTIVPQGSGSQVTVNYVAHK